MSLDNNIENAFMVVRKTYENVQKMINFMDEKAILNDYRPVIDRFLRYSSDKYPIGWLYNDIVKIYQYEKDNPLESDWLNGPIYVVNISFNNKPKVIVAKFNYDIEKWGKGISMSSSWAFTDPLNKDYKDGLFKHQYIKELGYFISKPINGDIRKRYWDMESAIYKEFKLSEVTAETLEAQVFGEFENMKKNVLRNLWMNKKYRFYEDNMR